MTDLNSTATPARPLAAAHQSTAARIVLPLWIAAVSLAAIAIVLIIGSIELVQALHQTQASVQELQQQVQQMRSGLGGLLGG